MLFNKQVSEERINEVKNKIYELWNGWRPYQTNVFDLYKKAGENWTKIDLFKLTAENWNDSWKDMPLPALEYYIQSLPEFGADIFKKITGLDSRSELNLSGTEVKVEIQGKSYTATIK